MRVLLISDGENKTGKSIIDAIKSAEIGVTDISSLREELKNHDYDFVIAPKSLISGFHLQNTDAQSDADLEASYAKRLSELFAQRSGELAEYLAVMKNEIFVRVMDAAEADRLLCGIYTSAIANVFADNEWLELYLAHENFEGQGSAYLEDRLTALCREFTALFPPVNSDKTEEVIRYILNNPESDLRQKTIASKMYVNSSYLSTVFAAQTGERFVDYLTSVKLKRASYLLMNSALRVSEIAARLDYKDIGYFSRLFKARYGIPPSEYRIPDNYTYEI